MRRHWRAAALIAVALSGLVAYLLRPRGVDDYLAGASGVVVSTDGSPIPGVNVRFKSAEVMYQAISPVRSAQAITDAKGRFSFCFISCGRPGGHYRLTFEKPGFQTVVVRGSGSGQHQIVMKAANERSAG